MDSLEDVSSGIKKETPGANVRLLDLDLENFSSVRKAAKEVLGYKENFNVLFNNSGIMAGLFVEPRSSTFDGLIARLAHQQSHTEPQTKASNPKSAPTTLAITCSPVLSSIKCWLRAHRLSSPGSSMCRASGIRGAGSGLTIWDSRAGRIVGLSEAETAGETADLSFFEDNPWVAYGQSKTANILFSRELAKRYGDRLLAFSLHPGGEGKLRLGHCRSSS
jgi:NAD(P)-dependent dehydrogenase (short-subunit alcohol dehydrogenase family)